MDNNELKKLIKKCIAEVKQEEYIEELMNKRNKHNNEFQNIKTLSIISSLIGLFYEGYLLIIEKITYIPYQIIPIVCLLVLINSLGTMVLLKYEINRIDFKISSL